LRLFFDNLLLYAAVALTPSTETSSLPSTNLLGAFRSKPWRTGATQAAETLVIDLGSAKAVTSLILLDHTLTNADTGLAIQGNSSNSWGSPAFSQNLTWTSGTITQTFASQNYRYWRLTFTKTSSAETRDIGVLFLGTYYDSTEQPDYDGYQRQVTDLSVSQRTIGGQLFVDKRSQFRAIKLDFAQCNAAQVNQIVTVLKLVGTAVSFFVIVDTNGTGELAETIYVKFSPSTMPMPKVDGFDADLTYTISLLLEEQL
jgi:hypothetical protein